MGLCKRGNSGEMKVYDYAFFMSVYVLNANLDGIIK